MQPILVEIHQNPFEGLKPPLFSCSPKLFPLKFTKIPLRD
ncbi:hypothetical protein CKA32_001393 [Geitlerinema sp. FC II]|nr:hypothetical protein CKA32_001393 [Geitlerinema sp. FC II]